MVLDMSIDRLSYLLLMSINSLLYPSFGGLFLGLGLLDGISHMSMVAASLLSGGQTHKNKEIDFHWLLKLYYSTHLLFTLCLCSEVLVT